MDKNDDEKKKYKYKRLSNPDILRKTMSEESMLTKNKYLTLNGSLKSMDRDSGDTKKYQPVYNTNSQHKAKTAWLLSQTDLKSSNTSLDKTEKRKSYEGFGHKYEAPPKKYLDFEPIVTKPELFRASIKDIHYKNDTKITNEQTPIFTTKEDIKIRQPNENINQKLPIQKKEIDNRNIEQRLSDVIKSTESCAEIIENKTFDTFSNENSRFITNTFERISQDNRNLDEKRFDSKNFIKYEMLDYDNYYDRNVDSLNERDDAEQSDCKTEDSVIVYTLQEAAPQTALVIDINKNEPEAEVEPNKTDDKKKNRSISWKWKKSPSTKKEKLSINLKDVERYKLTNIPLFLVKCIKRLKTKELLGTEGIYRGSSGYDFTIKTMKHAIKDKNYTEIDRTTDGILLSGLVKHFFKQLQNSILKSDYIDEKLKDELFKDKLVLNEIDDDMKATLKEMIYDLSDECREIFLYFILHIVDVVKKNQSNLMEYSTLASLLSPCLFSNKTTKNLDLFLISSNQTLLLQFIFENYTSIFDQLILQEIEHLYNETTLTESIEINSNAENDQDSNAVVVERTNNKKDKNSENSKMNSNFRSSLTNLANKFKHSKSSQTTERDSNNSTVFYGAENQGESKTDVAIVENGILHATPVPPVIDVNVSDELENPIQEYFSFAHYKKTNIRNANKQKDTNIPEIVFMIVQTLTVNGLNSTPNIYELGMTHDEMKDFVEMIKRKKDDELKRYNNGAHLAYFLKEYINLFDPPILENSLPSIEIYKKMTNYNPKIDIKHKKYVEYIDWIDPIPAKQTFMFLIKHLNDVANESQLNQMTAKKLSEIWVKCLYSEENSMDSKNIAFLEYCILNYKKLFSQKDFNIIMDLNKTFYEPGNLPLPVTEQTQHCCIIS